MPTVATFPKYIPLSQAAMQLNIDLAKLHDMASLGKIKAIRLPDGGLAVNEAVIEQPLRKEDLSEYKQFAHLSRKTTWISKAERDYDIPNRTISRWADDGVIKVTGMNGNKKLLNAQDMAYCAFIYQRYKEEGTQGRHIFDSDGLPYKPKTGPFA